MMINVHVYIQIDLSITPSDKCLEAGKYKVCEIISDSGSKLVYK